MTPLERAATALHESLTTADISMNGDLAAFAVIAVLKAIREPTPEMLDAKDGVDPAIPDIDAADIWRAMIDSLTNTPTGAAK